MEGESIFYPMPILIFLWASSLKDIIGCDNVMKRNKKTYFCKYIKAIREILIFIKWKDETKTQ